MKLARFSVLLAFGLVMALLAGCFNPISVTQPGTPEETGTVTGEPVTVPVQIGNPSSRSIVGGSWANITQGKLYNFIQLVVVDSITGNIVGFTEQRKAGSADDEAVLAIGEIPYGKTYKFLLLLGYWPRNISMESAGSPVTYVYDDTAGVKPVLLAAGYLSQPVSGSSTVYIDVWPLIIDTTLEQGGNVTKIGPTIGTPVDILQGTTAGKVNWIIGRQSDGSDNGLTALLVGQSGPLTVKSRQFFNGSTLTGSGTTTTNTFTYSLPLKNALGDVGTTYGVNFQIEYVPFNKTAGGWNTYITASKFDLSGSNYPVWIIRNGLNNDKQNANTDFSRFGNPGGGYTYKNYNANGGILVKVKETAGYTDGNGDGIPDGSADTDGDGYPDEPGASTGYLLYNGSYKGSKIVQFSTRGYTDNAEVYYLVTDANVYNSTSQPPYNLFTSKLGNYAAGTGHTGVVNSSISGPADIWLVFIKDAKVSNRIAVKTGSGGLFVGWGWGDDETLTATELLNEIIGRLTVPAENYILASGDLQALTYTHFNAGPRAWSYYGGEPVTVGENFFLTNTYAVSFTVTLKDGTLPNPFEYADYHPTEPNARVIIQRTSNTTANVNFIFGNYAP